MELKLIAPREARLLSLLRGELQMSSTLVKRLKYRDAYRVNGNAVHTNFPVQRGDCISVRLDEPTPLYPAEEGALQILYEDAWLIALDKPPGMLVHPSSACNTGTLANRLSAYYQRTGQACAVHPVSRLDRDTFGVILLAKNAHAHAKLCALSKAGALQKRYHALTYGLPPACEGLLDAPIARKQPPSLLRCIRDDGKPAQTSYRLLERRGQLAKLELHPLTGRTHQLRVHCTHFGFPILGDPQYSSEAASAFSAAQGLQGQQLCAVCIGFPHPIGGEFLQIMSKQDVSLDFLSDTDI